MDALVLLKPLDFLINLTDLPGIFIHIVFMSAAEKRIALCAEFTILYQQPVPFVHV